MISQWRLVENLQDTVWRFGFKHRLIQGSGIYNTDRLRKAGKFNGLRNFRNLSFFIHFMRMYELICFIYVVDALEKHFREVTKMVAAGSTGVFTVALL